MNGNRSLEAASRNPLVLPTSICSRVTNSLASFSVHIVSRVMTIQTADLVFHFSTKGDAIDPKPKHKGGLTQDHCPTYERDDAAFWDRPLSGVDACHGVRIERQREPAALERDLRSASLNLGRTGRHRIVGALVH